MKYLEDSSGGRINRAFGRWLPATFLVFCLIGSAVQIPVDAASGGSTMRGEIQVPSHVPGGAEFDIMLIDDDLDFDNAATDDFQFHIDEGDATAVRDFVPGNSTLEIRVNGQAVTLVTDGGLDLDFEETGPNTGVFVLDEMFNVALLNSVEFGSIDDGDIIDFVHTDLLFDPLETTISTVVVGDRARTYIVLDQVESVVPTSMITVFGKLYDLENATELSGKQITISGTGVPVQQVTTTAGIIFESTNLSLRPCSTVLPAGTSDGSSTPDISDDHYPDCLSDEGDRDGVNNVLHLGAPGGRIILPPGITIVTLQLHNTANNGVIVSVTHASGPPSTVATSGFCPDVTDLNLVSDREIRQIDIMEVIPDSVAGSIFPQCVGSGYGTVGISRFEASNPDGNPSDRYVFDFEDLVAGSVSNRLELGSGSFFVTFAAPDETQSGLTVQASSQGDSEYLPSQSVVQLYNTIEPTVHPEAGAGGQPTTGIVPDSDVGITTISCITDSDKDGLCNTWESTGTGSGIPYKNGGVGPTLYHKLSLNPSDLHLNNPDIWVEIDYMDDVATTTGVNESHIPSQTALDRVKNVFLDRPVPIFLHYDIDDPLVHVAALNVWLDNETPTNPDNDFYSIKQIKFGTSTERSGSGNQPLQNNDMLKAKSQAYHYALFVHSIGPCPHDSDPNAPGTPSGLAEVNGNDFIVSLGCGYGPYDTDPATHDVGTENEQAGTFMHELGHNLNLDHGGPREFLKLPTGYSLSGTAPNFGQTNTIGDNGPSGGDGTRSFTVRNIKVVTPGASSGTVDITTTVKFSVDPGVVNVGTVTRSIPGGSTILVDSITPSVSQHSAGTGTYRQINLKVRFTTTGSTNSVSGDFGTFTVPLTVTNWGATISTSGGLTTTLGPRLMIDISSVDFTMNCKANYPSVMTYSQQFGTIYEDPIANPQGYVWYPAYSNWTGSNLAETQLSESSGLSGNANYIIFTPNNGTQSSIVRIPTSPINWRDGSSGMVQSDINYFKFRGCGVDDFGITLPNSWETQKGFNDWDNLQFNFKEGKASLDGVYLNTDIYWREGTFEVAVAPEFGPLAMLAFAAAIIGIIAATMRYEKAGLQ